MALHGKVLGAIKVNPNGKNGTPSRGEKLPFAEDGITG